jgi:cytochrome P450
MNIFPSPEQRLFPFQFYADMRHNNPVAYDDRKNVWAVFRYYDVQSILGDYARFSSAPSPTIMLKRRSTRPSLLRSDPPYHRTLRAVVASAFTPMTISKLEPRIESITHDLLNLISDLAFPYV